MLIILVGRLVVGCFGWLAGWFIVLADWLAGWQIRCLGC